MRKVVFWDFDGTLAEHYPIWAQVLWEAAAPFAEDYGLSFEKLRPLLHRGFPWHQDGNPSVTGEAWWEDRVVKFIAAYESFGVPKPLAERAARSVREKILDPRRYHVYPDAAATLALCAYKGYQNYLLSDNFPELPQLLEKLFLRPFFRACVVSGQEGLCKPDVRLFRRAELAAHFPGMIWMVGDNPQADIAGAKAAGWHTIQVHREDGEADFTCPTLTDVWRLL